MKHVWISFQEGYFTSRSFKHSQDPILKKTVSNPKKNHTHFIPKESNPSLLYGLPKILKGNVLLSPNVILIISPTYQLYTKEIHEKDLFSDTKFVPFCLLALISNSWSWWAWYHVPIYKSFCSRFWDFCWGVVGPWWSVFRLSSLIEKCLPSTYFIFLESFSNKPLDMEFFRSDGSWVCLYKSKCGFRYFDDRFFVWRENTSEYST